MALAILFLLAVGAGLAILISLTNLRVRVRLLAEELRSLRARVAMLEGPTQTGTTAPGTAQAARSGEAAPVLPPEPTMPPKPAEAEKAPAPPPRPSRTKQEWEALIGGKVLNRIGALALIIGIGFFLKFAFDRNWITETFRVLIGAAAGLVSLAIAARTHRKGFHVFAQGLVGAGIAILYLSVYASFNFYALVSQLIAFLLMSAVTVIAFTQALRYDSPAVSLLGLIGGFLTPFLLSTGESNTVGLFSYITLLDIGLVLVAWKKESWLALEPLAMLGTYATFTLWQTSYYTRSELLPAVVFLSLFWLMFHLLDLRHLRDASESRAQERRVLAVLHGLVVYVLLSAVLFGESSEGKALGALSLGAAYAVSLLGCRGSEIRFLAARAHFALASAVLLVMGTAIECSGLVLPVAWALEGLCLAWLGFRVQKRHLWACGLLIVAMSWVALLFTPDAIWQRQDTFLPLLNVRVLAFAIVIGSTIALTPPLRSVARAFEETFHYAWGILLFILATVENADTFAKMSRDAGFVRLDHIEFLGLLTLGVVWIVVATLLSLAGLRRNIRPLIYMPPVAILAGAILLCGVGFSYSPIELFSPVFNARAGALLLALAATLLHLWWFRERSLTLPGARVVATALNILAPALGLFLLGVEVRDIFQQQIARLDTEAWPDLERLENLKQLSLSGLFLLYSIGLMVLGLVRRSRLLRLEAIGLFGFAIAKIFVYDLSFLETLYRIFSFIGLGLILLLTSYLYQRYKSIILEESRPG